MEVMKKESFVQICVVIFVVYSMISEVWAQGQWLSDFDRVDIEMFLLLQWKFVVMIRNVSE